MVVVVVVVAPAGVADPPKTPDTIETVLPQAMVATVMILRLVHALRRTMVVTQIEILFCTALTKVTRRHSDEAGSTIIPVMMSHPKYHRLLESRPR